MTGMHDDLTVDDYATLRATGTDHLLLDVREADEVAFGSIAGSLHIPLRQLPLRLAGLAAWKDRLVVCQCKVGGRSAQAAAFLRRNGFTQVRNLAGGIAAWRAAIDPAITVA